MLMGRRGALHRAPFFNRSALSPCGHRSKATMGLVKKKKKSKFGPYEGETTAVTFCSLVMATLFKKVIKTYRFLTEE